MQLIDIELKKVTFHRGDSPHPFMLIFLDGTWQRFPDGVPVSLCDDEVAQIPKQYFDDGLLTVENITRTVVAK